MLKRKTILNILIWINLTSFGFKMASQLTLNCQLCFFNFLRSNNRRNAVKSFLEMSTSCMLISRFKLFVSRFNQVSQFDITLFADDTFLMLSDKNLNNFENKVNNELNKIDYWLKKTSYR